MKKEKNLYLSFKEVQHGTAAYDETISLRYRILREPLGLVYTDEQLKAEAADHHLACYLEDELAACLVLSPIDKDTIKMRQVAVRADLQGKSIGRALVTYSEYWVKERGFKLMTLHARETAVPFYLRLDYKKEGKPFMEVGLTHYKMSKELT